MSIKELCKGRTFPEIFNSQQHRAVKTIIHTEVIALPAFAPRIVIEKLFNELRSNTSSTTHAVWKLIGVAVANHLTFTRSTSHNVVFIVWHPVTESNCSDEFRRLESRSPRQDVVCSSSKSIAYPCDQYDSETISIDLQQTPSNCMTDFLSCS